MLNMRMKNWSDSMSIRRFITNPHFGGFGQRLVASFLDSLLVLVIIFIATKLMGYTAEEAMRLATGIESPNDLGRIENIVFLLTLVYYIVLPATPLRGTIGKMIMKLEIVTEQGNRISLLRSLWRYIATFFSSILLFFGFIMIIFHPEKRGLHDLMANTYVLKKTRFN